MSSPLARIESIKNPKELVTAENAGDAKENEERED
jgi:hypothetical protein